MQVNKELFHLRQFYSKLLTSVERSTKSLEPNTQQTRRDKHSDQADDTDHNGRQHQSMAEMDQMFKVQNSCETLFFLHDYSFSPKFQKSLKLTGFGKSHIYLQYLLTCLPRFPI